MSLALQPRGSVPSTRTSRFFAFFASSVCVASTCSTSLVPMPCASAPNAPCVEVWLSPQTTVMPGSVAPCSGPITCTMPWRLSFILNCVTPRRSQLASSVSTCRLRRRIGDAAAAVGGGHVVVAHREVGRQPPHLAPGDLQALEGLRAGDLVQQVAVDVQQRGAVFLGVQDVVVPELVVEGASCHGEAFQMAEASRARVTRRARARPREPAVGGHSASTKRCTAAGSESLTRVASR